MVQIIRREAMQQSKRLNARAWRFDGADHDFGDVSLFINELALGDGPGLHTHTYDEIFVVVDGQSTFTTLDGETPTSIELATGDVARVPAGTPHAFTNSGDRVLRQVDIHLADRIALVWLE
ncbi:MAG: cupin domain-containing protein [Acetobacteraceae bacterium]